MPVEVDINTLSVTKRAVCVRGTSRHVDRTRPVRVRAFHGLLHYYSAAFAQCIQTFSESLSVLLEKLSSERLWIELPYIPRLCFRRAQQIRRQRTSGKANSCQGR